MVFLCHASSSNRLTPPTEGLTYKKIKKKKKLASDEQKSGEQGELEYLEFRVSVANLNGTTEVSGFDLGGGVGAISILQKTLFSSNFALSED